MSKLASLRKKMLKHKMFLYCLYHETTKQSNARLTVATACQIKCLIKILHYISAGIIPLKKNNFAKLQSARKVATLNRLSDYKEVKTLLKSSLPDQKKIVKKFGSVYPNLLHACFNEY